MMTHWSMLVTLLILATLQAGCSRPPASDEYFPLEAGLEWHYDVELRLSGNNIERDTLRMRSLGLRDYNGEPHFVRRSSDNTDYYLKRDSSGIYRVAKRTTVELRPAADQPIRPVLLLPPQPGQIWSNQTQTFTLHRVRPQYEPPSGVGMPFSMSFEVLETDASVEVPAGRFAHCLRIRGESQISFYNDALRGHANVFVVQNEWHCRGVGLVKLERDEPLDTGEFRGGYYSLQLRQFDD